MSIETIMAGDQVELSSQLLENGVPKDITGASIFLKFENENGVVKEQTATITDALNGKWKYQLLATDFDTPGLVQAWVRWSSGGRSVATVDPYRFQVRKNPVVT